MEEIDDADDDDEGIMDVEGSGSLDKDDVIFWFSNNNSSSLVSRLDRLSWRFLFGVVTIDAEQIDVDDEDDNDDSNSYFVEVKSSSFEFFVNFAGENI